MPRPTPPALLALALTLGLLGCPPAESDRRGQGPEGADVPPPTMPASPRATASAAREPVAVASPAASPEGPAVSCTCAAAREDNGWCEACGKGYAGGEEQACATCARAAAEARGGWCEEHGRGYLFRAPSDCQACVSAATGVSGWCATHGMGFLKGEKTKCRACAEGGTRCAACAGK